jgi:hypothetical protein
VSDSVQFVDFFGEQFAAPARMNSRLVIRFQRMAAEGADTADVDEAKAREAAIMLDKMIEQSVRPEDRPRFEDVCDRELPSDEELMKFVADVLAAVAGRPTSRPSDSSDGPTNTRPNSGGDSSLAVVHRLEERGRPDLALMVTMSQEARSAV